jgi:circadian clock protein KaiC
VTIVEVLPSESLLDEEQQQSLLYSSDLELGEATRRVFEAVDAARPDRVVIDSLSEILLLAQSPLRFRRQLLAIKHFFSRRGATVLMLDDMTATGSDGTMHSLAHGVLRLEQLAPSYGAERRRLRVVKYRGRAARGGFHDFVIRRGGVQVFPRLVSAEHRRQFERTVTSTGDARLDALMGGGPSEARPRWSSGPRARASRSLF